MSYCFGLKIKRLREALGLNQSELARRSGIARTTIVQLENGKRISLSVRSLVDLAHALNISIDELIADTHLANPELP